MCCNSSHEPHVILCVPCCHFIERLYRYNSVLSSLDDHVFQNFETTKQTALKIKAKFFPHWSSIFFRELKEFKGDNVKLYVLFL